MFGPRTMLAISLQQGTNFDFHKSLLSESPNGQPIRTYVSSESRVVITTATHY
jgi:hypothetical protein